jgi:tetratricopeptide (TPR) repeat protein
MKNIVLYSLLAFSIGIFAQEKDKNLPKGNQEIADKNYSEAESEYRISASKFPKKAMASYNLGNAIYSQKQAGEAKLAYAHAIEKSKTFPEKHNAFHNMGNALMLQKKYDEAAEAYKNALRNNPEDEETRYNYALAKKKDKENPNKNKDKNKDKDKDKKDKNKKDQDNKDQDKKEDKKDDKQEDKPNNGEPKETPGSLSKEQVKNMMEAVNNEEKKIQDKVNGQKTKGKPVKNEKDW